MGFLSKYSPQILGVLRIVAGLLFLEHGLMKMVGFPSMTGAAMQLQLMHLPPLIMAAAVIEVVGGALIILGLFSRFAAFICSGEMAFAYFMAHFPMSIYPALNKGDGAILFCFLFLYLAASGPGAFAINDK